MSERQRREDVVLRWLAYQLRVATASQLVAGLTAELDVSSAAAKSELLRLARCGLLSKQTLPVTVPELTEPLVAWSPRQAAPNFEAVAWAARKRLALATQRREVVLWASDLAVRRVGGLGGHYCKPLQVEHDLGVTAIYFARCRQSPETAQRWIGEDDYARLRRPVRGQKRPDAVFVDGQAHISLVLDYLSLYPPAHLRGFHYYWAARNTRYEWW